ncbi:PDDEXK-like family protein [Marinobacterium weihaiense]|uniref:PD-(D/E)XK nuclease family protein n=1 Tax=Marinobacterium weihaiense TaxID=2851016 RepID=A0ABS6M627_9GAMM|nr:PD-(D/E)XK nuclease family protein [Marinobacterium weihaiense]MBV0931732.1 PD-(D/E)XK nuclease family protein [Marinobacterium weihaiense]
MSTNRHACPPAFARLSGRVEQCRTEANRQGEQFNIFAILGVQRDEARTHSRFLAELLDPNGRHGMGSCFLQVFKNDLLQLNTPVSSPVRVTRELSTEERRRIDIVVDMPDRLIGIEVKVDAADQPAQLADYHAELEQRARGRKHVTLVYLTLDGKAPSADSLKGLDSRQVHCLSFARDIRHWLNSCHASSQPKPELAHGILQYRRLIETLTGTGFTMTSMLADQLAHDKDDLGTALAVAAALPKAKTRVMLNFWQLLQTQLFETLGIMPEVYNSKNLRTLCHEYCHGKRDSKHVGLRIPISRQDGKTLCLYINLYHAIHYGLRLETKPGVPLACASTRDQFQGHFKDGNAVANQHKDWLVCYYHDPARQPAILNFHHFNEAVLALVEAESRQARVEALVQHQRQLIERARRLLDSNRPLPSMLP